MVIILVKILFLLFSFAAMRSYIKSISQKRINETRKRISNLTLFELIAISAALEYKMKKFL